MNKKINYYYLVFPVPSRNWRAQRRTPFTTREKDEKDAFIHFLLDVLRLRGKWIHCYSFAAAVAAAAGPSVYSEHMTMTSPVPFDHLFFTWNSIKCKCDFRLPFLSQFVFDLALLGLSDHHKLVSCVCAYPSCILQKHSILFSMANSLTIFYAHFSQMCLPVLSPVTLMNVRCFFIAKCIQILFL